MEKSSEKRRTRISFPVKIVFGVAMAFQLLSRIFPGRAVCERDVVIGDVVKEVDLILLEHEACGNRVDRRISPSLVKETAVMIERVEKVQVSL